MDKPFLKACAFCQKEGFKTPEAFHYLWRIDDANICMCLKNGFGAQCITEVIQHTNDDEEIEKHSSWK